MVQTMKYQIVTRW